MTENEPQKTIDLSEFIEQYYEMVPETEDVMPSGEDLEEGMRVVVEDPTSRKNLDELRYHIERGTAFSPALLATARMTNRWCEVTDVAIWDDEGYITFVGVYDDGVKRQRKHPIDTAWIVKKDSIDQSLNPLANALGYSEDQLKANLQMFDGLVDGLLPLAGAVKAPEYLVDPNPHADGSTSPWKGDGVWAAWARGIMTENEVINRKLEQHFPKDKMPTSEELLDVWARQRADYVRELRNLLGKSSMSGMLVTVVPDPIDGIVMADSDFVSRNFPEPKKED
jgi:hypothetical protein